MYYGHDGREYEDAEMDNMKRDASERDASLHKIAQRVLQNLHKMDEQQQLEYIKNLIGAMDDIHIGLFDFAIEMTPNQ